MTDRPAAADVETDVYTCCGYKMEWQADRVGTTVGGLRLVGWMVCRMCNEAMLVSRHQNPAQYSRVADGSDAWEVAKGARSIVCGGIKLRPEKGSDAEEIKLLLERIAKLPDLEAEVERLRTELGYRKLAAEHAPPSDAPACPGPDCMMCSGEACNLCDPGPGQPRCEHAVDERHRSR